jgi:hypothetical protein
VTEDLRKLVDDLDERGVELVGWIACCWMVEDGIEKLQVIASPEARRDVMANLASAQAALRQANGSPGMTQ